jgi:hypothetical protein
MHLKIPTNACHHTTSKRKPYAGRAPPCMTHVIPSIGFSSTSPPWCVCMARQSSALGGLNQANHGCKRQHFARAFWWYPWMGDWPRFRCLGVAREPAKPWDCRQSTWGRVACTQHRCTRSTMGSNESSFQGLSGGTMLAMRPSWCERVQPCQTWCVQDRHVHTSQGCMYAPRATLPNQNPREFAYI